RPVRLAPAPAVANGTWRSPIEIDPFTVSVEDKVGLLLATNAAALKGGARFVNSSMFFLREEKSFASTDGSFVVQTIYRTQPSVTVTAVSSDMSDFQTRQSAEIAPRGLGYEHVRDAKLLENAPKWAAEAVQKISAKPVEVGRYDLLLDPSHLWLTIHESVAHPTELDRALGFEANYAGTSFVSPPDAVLGKLRFGSPLMNIQGDRDQAGSLSAVGWDDEGVKPERFDIIRNGLFVDYQTTREQAPYLAEYYKASGRPMRSHGCSYSQSWSDVQFQRMPNVSLLPGAKDLTLDDLVAATDRGIVIIGDGSFSIDQQRYNAQFGGQLFYEVRGGKIVGMLKDVAYQMRTPEFWASLDMLGGKRSYFMGGAFNDGKGQPSQSNAVSHGCVPCRFRNVNVINTGRKA
ncbi:MAG: TldD/PmbA family protein, partial [Gemmatimonadaceae bacterium]|nr:TldD/PmbA family protein [Gemmatimonadaceae bacterium]